MLNLDDLMFTYKVGKLLPYFDWVIWGAAIIIGLMRYALVCLNQYLKN